MSKTRSFVPWLLATSGVFGWAAACSENATKSPADGGGDDSGIIGESGAPGDGAGPRDGGGPEGSKKDGGLGLLVDNMTAVTGTQISLQVPANETAGSYYTYRDGPLSMVSSNGQLMDIPVSAPVNPDGSQIMGKICFGGRVADFAGLGLNFAYSMAPTDGAPSGAAADAGPFFPGCAPPPQGTTPALPFDASHYGGVSFYILVDPSDAATPSIRFDIPDMQTGDKCSIPTVACATSDAGSCYDDFGANVAFTAGMWTKVSFQWSDLGQQNFGAPFTALETTQLIGMKWQVQGAGADAAAESFNFCISDIYFTP